MDVSNKQNYFNGVIKMFPSTNQEVLALLPEAYAPFDPIVDVETLKVK